MGDDCVDGRWSSGQEGGDGVRDRYLDLLEEIRMSKEEILGDKDRLSELVDVSNMLFKRIKTPWELKLDAKVTAISTDLVCSRMEKDFDVGPMTSERLVELAREGMLEEFYRYGMGCSLRMMRFAHCIGFLHPEEKRQRTRGPRSRLVVSKTETPRPATVRSDTSDAEDVPRMETGGCRRTEYFDSVIDAESFSRTVENIFQLSLGIRCGTMSLEYDQDVLYVSPGGSCMQEGVGHLCLEITYDEYMRIVDVVKSRRTEMG